MLACPPHGRPSSPSTTSSSCWTRRRRTSAATNILASLEQLIERTAARSSAGTTGASAPTAYEVAQASRRRLPPAPVPRHAGAARAARPRAQDHRRRQPLPDHQAAQGHAGAARPPPVGRRGRRRRRASRPRSSASSAAPRLRAARFATGLRGFATTPSIKPPKMRPCAWCAGPTPRLGRRTTCQEGKEPLVAATNINRVVLTGNLTRDPGAALAAERHVRLQAAHRLQHPAQEQRDRRVGGQAQLLRRHGLGRAGRELRPLPRQGPAGRASTAASSGASGRTRTATSASRSRSSPTPCSSSAAATTARGGGGGGFTPRSDVPVDNRDFQPAGAPAATAAPQRRPTTTSRSRGSRRAPPGRSGGRPSASGRPDGRRRTRASLHSVLGPAPARARPDAAPRDAGAHQRFESSTRSSTVAKQRSRPHAPA